MLSFQPPPSNNNKSQSQGQNQNQNNKFGAQSHNNTNKFGSNFSNKNVFQKRKGPSHKADHGNSSFGAMNTTNSTNPAIGRSSTSSNLSEEDLKFDQHIGGFDTNFNIFQQFNHNQRPIPKFLIYQSPALKAAPIKQDEWDKSNQQEMFRLEQNTSDVSTLYEDFQKMRENERKVMEQKGLVDKEDTRKTLEDAISFQGSCLEMCPVYERIRRSIENDVRKYEKDSNGKISKDKAIKAFSRPAAGQPPPLPSDVRPPQILFKTLNYIVDNILPDLPESQSFIWDRTRSIRQDFTYQNYFGPEAMDCNERTVRIHILTLHVMAKTRSEFSQQQELEQMNKALKTLSEMYAEYRSRGIQAPNEAEFRAYYLISQLRDPELDREIQSFPDDIINDKRVQLALNLRNLVQTNIIERGFQPTEDVLNFYKNFFQNFSQGQIPILLSYLLEIHLNEIRFYAIKSLKRSLHAKSKPYPSDYMINLLAFNDFVDLSNYANYYGLKITKEGGQSFVDLLSLAHPSHLLPDQKPLVQAFFDKHDAKVTSYKELIESGVSNIEVLNIPSSIREPIPLAVPTNNFNQQPKAPSFNFSFPQNNTIQPNSVDEEQAKLEELKKSQEKEALLKKKLEEEKAKRDQQRALEEQRRKEEQEQKRLQQLENEKIAKEQERQKKIQLVSSLSETLTQNLIKSTIGKELTSVLKPLVESEISRKQKKKTILNSFSEGLFEAFVGELIYIESLEILADNFRKFKLKKLLIKKVSHLAKESREKVELKKRKREEFLEASKTFGIPKIIAKRKKLNHHKKKNISVASQDEYDTKVHKDTKNENVDLNPLNFEQLTENLKNNMIDKYEILMFFQDLNTTRSIFLRRKFSIDKTLDFTIGNHLKIMGTSEINPSKFNNVNLLIFNCDGIESIREQRVLLKELINGISLNSNFKFEVLIVFWELKGLIKLSKNEILKELNFRSNDTILNVDVLKIDGDLKIESLQRKVDELGTKFGYTAKGEYNLKHNKGKFKTNVGLKSNDQLKIFKDGESSFEHDFIGDDNKFYKHLQKHIEASPKRVALPKLLSNFNKSNEFLNVGKKKQAKIEVYSTPRPKSSELLQTPSFYNDSTGSSISNLSNITFANQSSSTPINIINKPSYAQVVKNSIKQEVREEEEDKPVPKSILELRKLAASVRERHGKKKE